MVTRPPSTIGARLDLYQSNNFVLEIEGLVIAGFRDCTGLQIEAEPLEYRTAGQNDFLHRVAATPPRRPLVLKHGLSQMDGLWRWHQDVLSGVIERRSGTIYLLNHARAPVAWWKVRDAIPLRWKGPEPQADAVTVTFQSVELVHRGLVRAKSFTAEAAVPIAVSEPRTR